MSQYEQTREIESLKRWRVVLGVAIVVITLGNGMLLANMRHLRETNTKSLMKMNTAYQNLRQDYEDVSEHVTYLLEQLRKQTQNPSKDD